MNVSAWESSVRCGDPVPSLRQETDVAHLQRRRGDDECVYSGRAVVTVARPRLQRSLKRVIPRYRPVSTPVVMCVAGPWIAAPLAEKVAVFAEAGDGDPEVSVDSVVHNPAELRDLVADLGGNAMKVVRGVERWVRQVGQCFEKRLLCVDEPSRGVAQSAPVSFGACTGDVHSTSRSTGRPVVRLISAGPHRVTPLVQSVDHGAIFCLEQWVIAWHRFASRPGLIPAAVRRGN